MELVIVIRKKVEDPAEGNFIYQMVKERLNDRPDVKVTGHVTNHFVAEEPPPNG